MRETAETAAREAPGEWRNHEENEPFYLHGITCDVMIGGQRRRGVVLQANLYLPHEACERHVVETQPSAVLALLDRLEWLESERDGHEKDLALAERVAAIQLRKAERERDALREKLAAAERPSPGVVHQDPPRPLSWSDVLALEDRVEELRWKSDGAAFAKAAEDLAAAKAAWGLSGLEKLPR